MKNFILYILEAVLSFFEGFIPFVVLISFLIYLACTIAAIMIFNNYVSTQINF